MVKSVFTDNQSGFPSVVIDGVMRILACGIPCTIYPHRCGVIDLPSRQIIDYFTNSKHRRIVLVSRPSQGTPVTTTATESPNASPTLGIVSTDHYRHHQQNDQEGQNAA